LAGSFALLFALAEIGFWINALGEMDFDRTAATPNFDQQWSWFSDLGVSYHVGFYAFSFWLAGLAVVVMAAAIAYGFWVGRERPRAYFGLMLFLTAAVVGVFAAQDLLLFYVFFEAMMIPLYVLIGVWGGPGRMGATVKFVIYTMAGSLLMLVAVIVFGLSRNSFDLVTTKPSNSTWLFLGFAIAFASRPHSSRCTAGCPTRIASRRPKWPPCCPG
jgi:NADH-quinone oxidoreductase subunit M